MARRLPGDASQRAVSRATYHARLERGWPPDLAATLPVGAPRPDRPKPEPRPRPEPRPKAPPLPAPVPQTKPSPQDARLARKLLRETLVACGVCPVCETNPARPNRTRCAGCSRRVAEYGRELHEARRRAGICVRCGKNPARDDGVFCETCRERANDEQRRHRLADPEAHNAGVRARYQQRVLAGMCTWLGCKRAPETGRRMCRTHLDRMTELSLASQARRKRGSLDD